TRESPVPQTAPILLCAAERPTKAASLRFQTARISAGTLRSRSFLSSEPWYLSLAIVPLELARQCHTRRGQTQASAHSQFTKGRIVTLPPDPQPSRLAAAT